MQLKIENFRSFDEETIFFDDYTCLVGPNGSGKSVVLMALNIFFQETSGTVTNIRELTEEDFHHKNTRDPVKITVTFEELSDAAKEEFKLYCRQGKLVIVAKAEWNANTQSATVKHFGSRTVMKEFAAFFQACKEGRKVADLRDIYRDICQKFPTLPGAATKDDMTDTLRGYEEKHPENCVLIDEPNQFYGFTRGDYHLENYVQWVYVPAVKDASTEQEEGSKTALGQLLARTVRTKLDFTKEIDELKGTAAEKYSDILRSQESALKDIELSMEKRLQDYINPQARLRLKWHYDAETSINIRDPVARADIGDGDFIGEIARAGHGMQRGFLLAVLNELVENEKKGKPKLLLGFEEPELYQHPPQAQHLADVLERLSRPQNNAQIIATTHSPYFVTSKGFENIRMFRKCPRNHCSKISFTTYAKVESRLRKALGEEPKTPTNIMAIVNQIMHPSQKELFFTPIAVVVEGSEDVAFISTHLHLSNKWDLFRALGCHFIVANGKCNMSRFVAIAQELGIIVFAVVDGDSNIKTENVAKNRKDNECLLNLFSISGENSLPDKTIWHDNIVMWSTTIGDTIRAEIGDSWDAAENEVRINQGLLDGIKRKNVMLITATLEKLWNQGKQSASLIKLCGAVLYFAQKIGVQKGN